MPLACTERPHPHPVGRSGRADVDTGRTPTELKPGKVFVVHLGGRRVVVKRSDAPWAEACAAALGPLAGVRTVPARAVHAAEWEKHAALPFEPADHEVLLVLPWVGAPTLARAQAGFDAHALGRLWAFDALIDNADRLVKGGNPFNILVADNGSLLAIDQRLGPAVCDAAGAGRVTGRRLARAATEELRIAMAHALFADFRGEAKVHVADPGRGARAFSAGVVAGIHAIAALDLAQVERAVALSGAGAHVRTGGFAEILRTFRAAAA